MVAYSFKRQFVDPIRSGTKAQTIRGRRIMPHAVPGDALQLYCGMRTKGCFLIARATCREVSPIRIVLRTWEIEIDGEELTPPEKARLARADGFHDWIEMRGFWRREHGFAVFEGVIIKWTKESDNGLCGNDGSPGRQDPA
jgi:hypothetical protein